MKEKKQTNLLFVTCGSNALGCGHINRCISIAKAINNSMTASFFLFGDNTADSILKSSGCEYQISSIENCNQISSNKRFEEALKSADIIIADLIHPQFFSDKKNIDIFEVMINSKAKVAAIDALGEKTLLNYSPDLLFDFFVLPYCLTEEQSQSAYGIGKQQLLGSEYVILSPEYTDLPVRKHRKNANRVLVTCGGSDPKSWSNNILNSLESINRKLEIRIIIGPLFEPELITSISKLAEHSKHNVEPINSPETLVSNMLWADIAITSSGLTKYELAATGTPTILFSIDKNHHDSNQSFDDTHIAHNLGVAPSSEKISEITCRLLDDDLIRLEVANKGQNIFDGNGAKRLLEEFTKELQ